MSIHAAVLSLWAIGAVACAALVLAAVASAGPFARIGATLPDGRRLSEPLTALLVALCCAAWPLMLVLALIGEAKVEVDRDDE